MQISHVCKNCKYFEPDTTIGPNSGQCRAHAPRAQDVNGLSAAKQWKYNFSVGNLGHIPPNGNGPEYIFIQEQVALYREMGAVVAPFDPDPAPVALPTTIAAGLNADDIFPLAIPAGYSLTRLGLRYSLANVGAASVATAVTCRLHVLDIAGANAVDHLINMPVIESHVGIAGNETDDYSSSDYILDSALVFNNGLAGVYIDAGVGEVDNEIAEIRNPFVFLEFSNYVGLIWHWPRIDDSTIRRCGEFDPIPGSETEV